jgi:predicted RNA binding protein YcfA (HicA-like mRNA interferase family)
MPIKFRDLIQILERDCRSQVAQKGSHRQFKHPVKRGKVTVRGKLSAELPVGTWSSILRQAELEDQS